MDILQRLDIDELLEMTAPLSRELFSQVIDAHCLVVEIPNPDADDDTPPFVLPHPDTLESGSGFRRSAPTSRAQFVLFLRKVDDTTHKGMYTVGRSSDCDLTISHMSVSKQHAYFQEQKGEFVLRDPSSTNGTFLDGRRVQPNHAAPVKSTSAIRFGDVATYFFSPGDLYDYVAVLRRTME